MSDDSIGSYRYALSLWIVHPSVDLSELPALLELRATRGWKVGEARTTPIGTPLKGLNKGSFYTLEVKKGSDDLPSMLRQTVDRFAPHKKLFNEIVSTGGNISFFVGWFSDFNSRDVLDWQLLRDLAALNISLDFDIYGPDVTPTDASA